MGEGLPRGNARDAFIASAVKACFKTQRAATDNVGLPLENIVVYCTCVANGSADVMTTDDVEYFQRGGESTSASEQRARATGLACLEMGFVQGHWRLNPNCETIVLAHRRVLLEFVERLLEQVDADVVEGARPANRRGFYSRPCLPM
jgi:hypothetical protein